MTSRTYPIKSQTTFVIDYSLMTARQQLTRRPEMMVEYMMVAIVE